MPGVHEHFSEWALAQALPADTFAAYFEARLQLLRERVWLGMEPEVQRQVQAELQRLERMDGTQVKPAQRPLALLRQHRGRRKQQVAAYLDRLAPALQERVRQEIRRRLPDA